MRTVAYMHKKLPQGGGEFLSKLKIGKSSRENFVKKRKRKGGKRRKKKRMIKHMLKYLYEAK